MQQCLHPDPLAGRQRGEFPGGSAPWATAQGRWAPQSGQPARLLKAVQGGQGIPHEDGPGGAKLGVEAQELNGDGPEGGDLRC